MVNWSLILCIWIEYRSCFLTFKIRLMYHLDTSNQKKYTQGKIEICRHCGTTCS